MKLIKDSHTALFFLASAVVLLASFIVVHLRFGGVVTEVIIHYDAYRKTNWSGESVVFYRILFLSTVMILIDFFISRKISSSNPFLAYMLALSALLFSTLIFIAMRVIMSVN